MEVERGLEIHGMYFGKEVLRIREELLLPCIACPTDSLAETVLRAILSSQSPGLMPVHVDDHDVNRNAHVAESLAKFDEFRIGILPIA